jgi:histidine decarboxylase
MTLALELAALRQRLDDDRPTNIGFPGAVDFDYSELLPFFGYLLNNVGDPFVDCVGRAHTKHLEREVVDFFAELFRAPSDDRWGYVTSGGSEGNEFGLHLARSLYPDGLVYFSSAVHYSVPKLVDRLRMPAIAVRSTPAGEMDYDDLRSALGQQRHRAAIVVATIGTTVTEAVDDVAAVRRVLHGLAIRESYVHADAALTGIPLALLPHDRRPRFDLADGADSIAVSGHKFVGSPFPCGVVLTRATLRSRVGRRVDYIGSVDATIGGSRSGHAPLLLWYAMRRYGCDGLRRRAEQSRVLAEYAVSRLSGIGVPAWRHPYAFTVVFPTPPSAVTDRWALASSGGLSHIVCMPGVSRGQVDAFVSDLATELAQSSGRLPVGA